MIDLFLLSCAYQLYKKLLSPQKRMVDGVHDLSVQLLEKDGAVQVILSFCGIFHYPLCREPKEM